MLLPNKRQTLRGISAKGQLKLVFQLMPSGLIYVIIVSGIISGCSTTHTMQASGHHRPHLSSVSTPRLIGAYGTLQPRGELRQLGVPYTGQQIGVLVKKLYVSEGQAVRQGEVLAEFDSYGINKDEADQLEHQLKLAKEKVAIQAKVESRFKFLNQVGGASDLRLERSQLTLLDSQQEVARLISMLRQVQKRLQESRLESPISGTILRIYARPGERVGEEGILEVGRTDRMIAELEVYESDAGLIKVGQPVTISSQDGAFQQELKGVLNQIVPQVRTRKVIPSRPVPDVDARVVIARVELDAKSNAIAKNWQGATIIARISTR